MKTTLGNLWNKIVENKDPLIKIGGAVIGAVLGAVIANAVSVAMDDTLVEEITMQME